MAQRVTADMFGNPRRSRSLLHTSDQIVFVNVMTADDTRPWIHGTLVRRKYKLPAPFIWSTWIFSGYSIGQLDVAATIEEVAVMQFFDRQQVHLQRLDDRLRQNGHAILASFAVAHQNLLIAEIYVLDAQIQ